MRKFDPSRPFGRITPPEDGRIFQQNGCFYGADHQFIEYDLSTREGQELAEIAKGGKTPVAESAPPKVQAAPKITESEEIEPTGEAIVSDESGLVHVPDESGDDVNADGEPASAEREQLIAYMNGDEPLDWFTAQSIAQQEFGERPATKKALRQMLGL